VLVKASFLLPSLIISCLSSINVCRLCFLFIHIIFLHTPTDGMYIAPCLCQYRGMSGFHDNYEAEPYHISRNLLVFHFPMGALLLFHVSYLFQLLMCYFLCVFHCFPIFQSYSRKQTALPLYESWHLPWGQNSLYGFNVSYQLYTYLNSYRCIDYFTVHWAP
jgi:hypothetical protein